MPLQLYLEYYTRLLRSLRRRINYVGFHIEAGVWAFRIEHSDLRPTYRLRKLDLKMEPKLVYRGLRQISDWALRYYSEIYVDGQENVPRDGPLIMCVHCPTRLLPLSASQAIINAIHVLEPHATTTRSWT